ncbi:MAG: hypothetical protein CVU56_29675, partial [Deltaproteobacteria bacterium HGW-Deltaproteobacteria-14]
MGQGTSPPRIAKPHQPEKTPLPLPPSAPLRAPPETLDKTPGRGHTPPVRTDDPHTLDAVLTLQLAVAWAGEADTDPPRLPYWRTALSDPFGGEDLLRRLAPRTWRWAVL